MGVDGGTVRVDGGIIESGGSVRVDGGIVEFMVKMWELTEEVWEFMA